MKRILSFLILNQIVFSYSMAQSINIAWEQSLGGTGDEICSAGVQTSDAGFIIAGLSDSHDGDVTGNHGDADFWIAKLNSVGKLSWENSYGGTDYDQASSIEQTIDGGYITAGNSWSTNGDVTGHHGGSDDYNGDYWVVKTDSMGNLQWEKAYGGSDLDEAK